MSKPKKLWKLDGQGGLAFAHHPCLADQQCKWDSPWEHPIASIIVMTACAVLDFVMFRQLFGSFLHEEPWIQYCSILGCIIGMDLAPIYLGILARKWSQGFRVSMPLFSLLMIAFLCAMLANILLRIRLRDLALPPTVSATAFSFHDAAAQTQTENPAALPYAIFASALPCVTSFVSFGVGYMSSDPLKVRYRHLSAALRALDEEIGRCEALLREYDEDQAFMDRLLEEDQEQYEIACNAAEEVGIYYSDYVRQRIKEHLGDAAATNALSKDFRENLTLLFGEEMVPEYAAGKT